MENKQLSLQKIMDNFNKPKLDNKVGFFRLLAVTQKAGLGIRDSLNAILNGESHPGMRKIIISMIESVSKGVSLAEALKVHSDFFNTDEIALIQSAETMGNMPEVLQNLSDELENHQKLMGRIKGAMIYPGAVIFIAILAVIILLIFVIPTMAEMFPDDTDLPGITVFMLGASDFMQSFWYLVVFGFVGIFFSITLSYKFIMPFKIWVDKQMISAPKIGGIAMKFNLYRFSKLLGDFYNAGVSPVESLHQISQILGNYHYKTKTINVKNDLELGLGFVESLEGSWLFDPILVQVIGIGEDTGNVGEVLIKMANFYRDQLDAEIEGAMKLIEPLLMAVIAIIVGVIVASVFLPMGDLVETIAFVNLFLGLLI